MFPAMQCLSRSGLRSVPRSAAIRAFVLPATLAVLSFGIPRAWATAASTTTTLTVTVSGSAVTSVAAGTVVTLTATVVSGSTPVNPGQVKFCDATAAHCEDSALLATAQLTTAGAATFKFRPAIGSHSYQAVFVGTTSYAKSTSTAASLTVPGPYPTTTTIASSGPIGNYTLTATVVGMGSRTLSPTGDISFLDTANGNALVGTVPLGPAMPGESFTTGSMFAVGDEPASIAVGDFNVDGIPDLAVTICPACEYVYNSGGLGSVAVLLGNGDGTFTFKSSPAVGNNSDSVAVGDFNGDGIPDLAVTNNGDNTVTVLLGNGDGTFSAKSTESVGKEPDSIATGDFNGDGIPDLAVANWGDNTVSVLLGNGDGTFTPKSILQPSPTAGNNPVSIAVGDFNGDGIMDLATANYYGGTVEVYLGNGDGTFTIVSTTGIGGELGSIAVGDFNGDGIPDLAVTDSSGFIYSPGGPVPLSAAVKILLGKGDGTFTTSSTPNLGVIISPVVVGDFNGDGIPDLAVHSCGELGECGNGEPDSVIVLLGNGDGTFTTQFTTFTSNLHSPTQCIAAGDFNGDGSPDLVLGTATGYLVATATVLLNQITTESATATLSGVSVFGTTHLVEASYPGDTNYSSSISNGVTLLAAKVATTLNLSSSPNPSPYTGQITLTATLSPYFAGGTTTDGETVNFYNGATSIGTGTLSSGVATLNMASPPVGTYRLTAAYPGDGNFLAAASNSLRQTVNPFLEPSSGFVVTVNTDDATGVAVNCATTDSSNCSLRDALAAAAAAGGGKITFAPTVSGIGLGFGAGLYIPSNTTIIGPAGGLSVGGGSLNSRRFLMSTPAWSIAPSPTCRSAETTLRPMAAVSTMAAS